MEENSELKQEFWKKIEEKISESVPELVKLLLTKCGYDSHLSLRNIQLEDVSTIERYMTENHKELLKHMIKQQPEYSDLKINRGQPFEFLPGHRKRIITIGEILTSDHESTTSHFKGTVKLLESRLEPLPDELSTRMKSELCSNILKWATGKKLNVCVIRQFSKSYFSHLYVLQHLQITSGINVNQIEHLMKYSNSNGSGLKCQVVYPVESCRTKITCIHKKYVRGGAQKNDKSDVKNRKAVWYFSNLKTHLANHQAKPTPQEENLMSLSPSDDSENKIIDGYEDIAIMAPNNLPEGNLLNENEVSLTRNMNTPSTRFQPMNTGLNSPLLSSPFMDHSSYATPQNKLGRKRKRSSVKNLIEKFSINDKQNDIWSKKTIMDL